jgi:hypothetical protein
MSGSEAKEQESRLLPALEDEDDATSDARSRPLATNLSRHQSAVLLCVLYAGRNACRRKSGGERWNGATAALPSI